MKGMADNFISLISYLESDELHLLKKQLDQGNIIYLVKSHGANTGDNEAIYYQVEVSEQDYNRSKPIIDSFKVSQFGKKKKCPKCGSPLHYPVKKLTFFQKILYIGTTPVKCKKCKTIFGI
jgi:hypothetical protein